MSATVERVQGAASSRTAVTTRRRIPQVAGGRRRLNLTENRRTDVVWGMAAVLLVVLAACLPLLTTRDFYFWDDTEIGAFPTWYHVGDLLRAGEWPILKPSSWMGGNIVAEGQWGLWSPLVLGISLLASATSNALVFTTAVKIAFLALAALGTYRLARSYDVRPPMAFAAGVAVPLNGFTMYMDAPDWVNGLMTWALLPYAWVALRRSTGKPVNMWAFFIAAYLIVTVGYFHGTIALCLVLLAVGVDRLLGREWRSVRTVAVGAVFVVLLGITVYLPAVLSAGVTARASQLVTNSGSFNADLGGLLSSGIPTAMFGVSGWWGEWTTTPLLYTTWFLPVLAFLSWTRLRPHLHELRDLGIVLLGAVLVVMGPSDAGPLRYPMRFMPYVALAGVVGLVVLLDRSLSAACTRRALARGGGLLAAGVFISFSQRPTLAVILLLTAGMVAIGLLAVWRSLPVTGSSSRAGTAVLAVVLAGGSVLSVGLQTRLYPNSPTDHFDMPGAVKDYRTQLPVSVNDVLVVGRPTMLNDVRTRSRFDDEPPAPAPVPGRWAETLVASSWYLNDARVQNTYSIIMHAAYMQTMCMNHRGETCPELLDRLFQPQPELSVPLVDVLSIDTLQILRRDVPGAQQGPPAGWSVAHEGVETVTWTRDAPVGPAGGVVWTSPGTSVTEIGRSDRTVRLRVNSVPEADGRAVFSRLAWPGYSVEGAQLAEPISDYLLAVDLGGASEGDIVDVFFSPPGWALARGSWVLAIVLGTAWSVGHLAAVRQGTQRQATNGGGARRRPAAKGALSGTR